ncbi:MAG: methionine--tRNA ligase subunit beta [Planctomycetota bacterium]|nr:methionine--tRNA ligase subunit beta [Planctomycetota bacterium]
MPDANPTPPPAPTPAPAGPAAGPEPKAQITFDDFARVDLRVARVVKAEPHPSADRLLKLQLDDGSGTPRQICAGIREQYKPEDLVGQLIVIVANLAPRIIRGEESRGMLLAASDAPKDPSNPAAARRVVVLGPKSDIAPGSIVS